MARMYSRATRTVAALMFSQSRILKLSVVGIGLAVYAGQHLPRLRRDMAKGMEAHFAPTDRKHGPSPANGSGRKTHDSDR